MSRRFATALASLLCALMLGHGAYAVQPDEVLSNPTLEGRARMLSEELRCMVCQNQSIDDSDADLARDLRVLVRERLVAGDSDSQVLDYVVARYGEFVLLKPRLNLRNALLWGAPIILLLCGGAFMIRAARARRGIENTTLSAEEKDRLDAILREDT